MKNDILNELSLFKVDSHFGRTCEIKKEVKFKRFLKRYVKKKLYMSLNNDKFN